MFRTDKDEKLMQTVDSNSPTRIDEATPDTLYYMAWKIPGTIDESGDFTEDTNQKILIKRIQTNGGVIESMAAWAKWSDRADGGTKWVPWEKREAIMQ